jgi:hypothetical protein
MRLYDADHPGGVIWPKVTRLENVFSHELHEKNISSETWQDFAMLRKDLPGLFDSPGQSY